MKAIRALQPKSLIQSSDDCSQQPISNISNDLNLSLDDWLFEPGEGFFDACVDQEEKNHTQSPLVLVDKHSRHVLLPSSIYRPQYAGLLQQEEYEPSSHNVDLNITTHGLSSPQQKRPSFDETASETGTIEEDNEANNVRDLRARPQQVAAIAIGSSKDFLLLFFFFSILTHFYPYFQRKLDGHSIQEYQKTHFRLCVSRASTSIPRNVLWGIRLLGGGRRKPHQQAILVDMCSGLIVC